MKTKTNKKYWILILCVLLFVLVFVSGLILGTRLSKFTNTEPYTEVIINDEPVDDEDLQETDDNETEEQGEEFISEPGMSIDGQMEDGAVVTELSIFRATYENDSHDITVRSLGGDKVVAPGTSNTHVIRVTNTGNCALDYELNVKDLFPNVAEDRVVPIEIRLADYEGNYVIGDDNSWTPLEDLDVVCDTGTVGKKHYVYYTLEWRWPFESKNGSDAYDTLLGVLSNTEKIECGITITTIAEQNENPDAAGGLRVPQTGDSYMTLLWLALAGVILLLIIYLLLSHRKDNEEE